MKLERLELRRVSLALRAPFETSFGKTETKQFLLVSASADGLVGHAECVADVDPYYLPETNATVLSVLRDFLAPIAFAREIAHPSELRAAFSRVRGHEMAKAALEMAVHELWARREGAPLWRVLGGRGGEIEAGVSIGLQRDDAALVDAVAREVEAGYRRVKVKIKPGRDLAPVEALRQRFPELPLMVDANSAYTLADADALQALDRFSLTMIEQPLAWDDIVDHATLQKRLATPICLDESIHRARRRAPRARARSLSRREHQGRDASAASRRRGPSTTRASRAASRSGAAACSSRASAGWRTSISRRCPASRCPATRRRAPATSRRTSSTRPSSSRRGGRSRCRTAPESATRSSGRASSGRPTSTRPGAVREPSVGPALPQGQHGAHQVKAARDDD